MKNLPIHEALDAAKERPICASFDIRFQRIDLLNTSNVEALMWSKCARFDCKQIFEYFCSLPMRFLSQNALSFAKVHIL